MESNWKEKAAAYFRDGLKITEIALLLDLTRQSVSSYIKQLPDYEDIKQKRKIDNLRKRRIYKTDKQSVYRTQNTMMAVTAETLKREHELAVMELSHEKYH